MTEHASAADIGNQVAAAPALPLILTVEQAADLLQMSTPVVRKLARDGTVLARRVGGQWRFSRDRLHRYIAGEN